MSFDVNSTEKYEGWTAEDLSFVILYCCSSFIGIIANIIVMIGIFSQNMSSRNILILSLCISDLMVCTIAMPLSLSTAFVHIWTMSVFFCKAGFFLQVYLVALMKRKLWVWCISRIARMESAEEQQSWIPRRTQSFPVAASTTSLMMLALDRYATVKRSRILSRFRAQTMIVVIWTGAALLTSPILYAREVKLQACRETWPSEKMKIAFTLSHIAFVYLIPCFTVASCHLSVGHKLCASSMPSLPLPIPLLRKPPHVIVVASVLPDEPSKAVPFRGNQEETSSENEMEGDEKKKSKPHLIPGRQNKPRSESGKGKRNGGEKPPLMRQISRQSLHSRRRLANMLVAMVIVFALCWAPYVVLKICLDTGFKVSASVLPFCLLLGHTHSAINPLVYYLSNRQSLSVSHGCNFHWPCDKSSESYIRRPPPSSTNEAALGVFHPCYTTKRFQPRGGCTNDYL